MAERRGAGRSGKRRRAREGSARHAGPDLLLGVRPVEEALRAGRREIRRLLLRSGRGGDERRALRELAEERGIPVEDLPSRDFDARVAPAESHQGVALDAGALPVISLQELPRAFARARVLVGLDGVEDPQNMGAIARVALAAGADGLVMTARRSPPLGAATSRASAGAVEHLAIARLPNLREGLSRLRDEGFVSVGAEPAAERDLYHFDPSGEEHPKRILVLGGEGSGLRPLLRSSLDHHISIPMCGDLQSLNVATAAAVILFEWRRQGLFPSGENAS